MTDRMLLDRLIKNIKENADGRQVVMYGQQDELLGALKKAGICIEKIFTCNPQILKALPTLAVPFQKLKGQRAQYYVIIPFFLPDGGVQQRSNMEAFGFREKIDYICFRPWEIILRGPVENYNDERGNVVNIACKNITLRMSGANHFVSIAKDTVVDGSLNIIISGEKNRLEAGEKCRFSLNNVIIMNNTTCCSSVLIGNNCRVTDSEFVVFGNSCIQFGDDISFSGRTQINASKGSKVVIGRDCMFSFDTVIQSGDGHTIFDINTGENINCNMEHASPDGFISEIHLGEHIWIGREAMIACGGGRTQIGQGSIIGAKSFVKGTFPNNCSIAGVPARVIRTDIAWSRKYCSNDIVDCGKYVEPTRGY